MLLAGPCCLDALGSVIMQAQACQSPLADQGRLRGQGHWSLPFPHAPGLPDVFGSDGFKKRTGIVVMLLGSSPHAAIQGLCDSQQL